MLVSAAADLNVHHAIAGARWVDGPAGPILEVRTEQCEARLSAYAAQVVSWTPTSTGPAPASPALFCSPRTAWGGGKAIRGGIPVCWPWFGARRDDDRLVGRASPAHGFARTRPWHVERVALGDNGRVEVTFLLVSDDDTLALWPHAFEARLTCAVGSTLQVSLTVTNVDDDAFAMEGALHTYLAVADVEAVTIHGLEGTRCIDKVSGAHGITDRSPLRVRGETDLVFQGTKARVVVRDPVAQRTITVDKSGSHSTVVWNPGLMKATTMADLGGDVWRSFLCVEAANVAPAVVNLSPGATHTLSTRITVNTARSDA